jgi:prophage DNA circulation protein
VYYRKATEGSFEPTYGDIETKLWDPIIQDRASDFGIQSSGAFAFDIKAEGIKGAQVKVEVSADLITWEAQEIFDMLSDDYAETFTDDLASSHSKRFYRLNMP